MTNNNDGLILDKKPIDGGEYQILNTKNDFNDICCKIIKITEQRPFEIEIGLFKNIETAKETLKELDGDDNIGKKVRIKMKNYDKVYKGKIVLWTYGESRRVEIYGGEENTNEKVHLIFDRFDKMGNQLIEKLVSISNDDKLQEAEYFREKMIKSIDFPVVFGYNLSAFLSASRSVLQYLLEDVKIQIGGQGCGQGWYDNLIKNSKYSKYFRDKRNINIHDSIIKTQKGIDIKGGEVEISYYFEDRKYDKDILQLCKNYMDELQAFLQEGNKKEFFDYF